MIECNSTVVVQAFHFLFAWWALSKFLFRPLVTAVQAERSQKKRLTTLLENEQTLLATIKKEQEQEWQRYCRQFKNRTPELRSHLIMLGEKIKKSSPKEPTQAETKRSIATLSDLIVQRVAHD